MKELNIEEKAKRYDEVLERAKKVLLDCTPEERKVVEYIFPELKESEDEKIRKELISFFTERAKYTEDSTFNGLSSKEILAWLEKQGEQKSVECIKDEILSKLLNKVICRFINNPDIPYSERDEVSVKLIPYVEMLEKQCEQKPTDKVEPKFHEGDWVVYDGDGYDGVRHITNINENGYYIKRNGHPDGIIPIANEVFMRLWTLQDAKAGDVLSCPNDAGDRDVVFIFKNMNSDEGWVFCFCASDANGCFCTNNDYVGNINNTNISPATKEQHDLLFKNMHEAGYKWDAEKKELKKIEQKPAEWSEEDKNNISTLRNLIYDDCNAEDASRLITWLKSLKDRVQPKQEWGEGDEYYYGIIQYILNNECVGKTDKEEAINWFKFLKGRFTWKPSDKQMKALEHAINCYSGISPTNTEEVYTLEIMKEQLKKLRKE